MAKFRMVHVTFWEDPKVIEDMTPEDKFFFLYLLTNQNTKQCGIYQITKKQASYEMGYSIESINSLFERFERHHKLIKYNADTRELAIKNWGKYNLNRAGTPMINCVKQELDEVVDPSLIQFVMDGIENKAFLKLFENHVKTDHVTGCVTDGVTDTVTEPSRGVISKKEEVRSNKDIKDYASGDAKSKVEYADFVFLTEAEHEKLANLLQDELEDYFIRFGSWISGQTARVQKSRSAYLTILNWRREDDRRRASQNRGRTVAGGLGKDHAGGPTSESEFAFLDRPGRS